MSFRTAAGSSDSAFSFGELNLRSQSSVRLFVVGASRRALRRVVSLFEPPQAAGSGRTKSKLALYFEQI